MITLGVFASSVKNTGSWGKLLLVSRNILPAMRTKLEANKLRSSKYPDMRKTLEYIAEHVPNTPWGKAAAEALK